MEIDEKDIIFGVFRYAGGHTEIRCHTDNRQNAATLFGALTYLAAHDDAFLEGLKYVIEDVQKNGAKIRELSALCAAEGKLVVRDKDKVKS